MKTETEALSAFHPAVSRWFSSSFAAPTEAQKRGWQAIRSGQDTLIAAPTGSGKTLAAFLASINDLLRQGLAGQLRDETQVVYVSPLRALSNDIHKNLAEPRRGVRKALSELGLPQVEIRAAVRTGDTPSSERQAMIRRPPHILVTTPESLYLLLTAERGREMLRTVQTLIVDEIHAVADDRRGSHLALSMERLERLARKELTRIGLSATQRPIEDVARFLVGTRKLDENGDPRCVIIDEGHRRKLDLGLEVPQSPLEAVMSNEVWEEVYDRIVELIGRHRTTLVFVNTRRLAERATRDLSERLGEEKVAAHHGSLSRELRLSAEKRLKEGDLKALVATASLELGIDIGSVDLVIQIGSPRTIANFLQRVGRSGHTLGAVPKGRIFPLSRDELVECAALLSAAAAGELDRLIIPERPLDILAQQIVAETAAGEQAEDEMFTLVRGAYPYRDLSRQDFDEVVRMLAEGFTTKRGRRGAHIHHDEVNERIRARRGARLAALTSGGAIPDVADYSVLVEPEGSFIGTVDEDFAIESMPGDIFQLGNMSWRILRIESGRLRVEDARGQPPTVPFWFGEAPERSPELSAAVSELRQEVDRRVDVDEEAAIEWLVRDVGLPPGAARQLAEYLAAGKRALGAMPTQDTVVIERFFDEAGGMQLVVHAPFGSRINRAWGLTLRKRFCRSFNFELEAAATEDAIILSLSTSHSFPLDEVFQYLKPETARNILVQAFLDAPVFPTRWRWNATRALAVLRHRGGRRVPPPLQRMESDDLLASVFPDQVACLENIVGDREVPDHPLVNQTVEDCLIEAMNIEGLERVLEAMKDGAIRCVAKDTTEPSPLAHEVINARPYAFLDNVPLEERRTNAVFTRRSLEPTAADEMGALDPAAIARVRDEVWPDVRDADELHDALLTFGFLIDAEGRKGRDGTWEPLFDVLASDRRATRLRLAADGDSTLWIAAERLPEFVVVFPSSDIDPDVVVPDRRRAVKWERESAIRELVRGRLEISGPTTGAALASSLGVSIGDIDLALLALETEGFVLRGQFTVGLDELEWCERRLLARIHRYTLNRLRAEIEPVSSADFMRFLFAWSRIEPEHRAAGPEGLASVLEALDGYEVPAAAWEADVLAARMEEYDPLWLDGLCLSGRVSWARLSPPVSSHSRTFTSGPLRSSPVALFTREHAQAWLSLAPAADRIELSSEARQVFDVLTDRGALFFSELVKLTGLLQTRVEVALGELVAVGLINADSFAGLRALLIPAGRRRPVDTTRKRRGRVAPFGVESAGRWATFRSPGALSDEEDEVRPIGGTPTSTAWVDPDAEAVETQAWALLRRYGVVFRRLLDREANLAPWRELTRVYRRLEARAEIRGGRFVSGHSGEQFALTEAVGLLRSTRREEKSGKLLAVSAADPLNLAGIITPGAKIAAHSANRVLYRDGIPVAALESGKIRLLADSEGVGDREMNAALTKRSVPPQLRVYLGQAR